MADKPDAHLETVIITRLTRRGAGKGADPVRIITQVWTLDGVLVAEQDPVVKKREGNEHEPFSVN